jgi:hypothetical protein
VNKSVQPCDYVFYLDECLGGNKVQNKLKEADILVELYSSHFPRGTADEEWLPVVGQKGWVLLTQDKGIKRRKNELMALRQHGVRAFIVTAKGLRGEEIGDLIVKVMPKILRILKKTHPPLIATINQNSVVELKEGLLRYNK